jgi:glycosyltransferase involved in cell wall biosynthesis
MSLHSAAHRTLCVLPNLPERRTGGGILLFEILRYLSSRGDVAVVLPVANHLAAEFEEVRSDPLLGGVAWHPLAARRIPGVRGYVGRLLSPLPAEVAKFATEANRELLGRTRRQFRPTVELAVSSWALTAYQGSSLPPGTRLYMVNVDPDIVRYDGPSLKRKLAAWVDHPKVDRLCRRAVSMAGRVGAISAVDVAALNRMGRRSDVTYVPPLMRPQPLDRSCVEPNHVIITTNFTYSQNVTSLEWFLRESWPHVDPRARLTVTGKDEGGRLQTLCKSHPRTSYAGCLDAAELDAAFARAAVAVNPTRLGSGFQIKLLDAIARGVPIVSTAFSNRLGSAIAASDDPRSLAELINARLTPGSLPPFDYGAFHREAVAAWDGFLFGS